MSPVRWNLPTDESEDEDGAVDMSRQYEPTLMYGRYKADLSVYAKETGEEIRRKSLAVPIGKNSDLNVYGSHNRTARCGGFFTAFWSCTFAKIGEDWVFLAMLGFLMAFLSFLMDYGIGRCNESRIWLYRDLAQSNPFLQYLSWVFLPVCLILFSAGFVQLTAPQAVGSGIPEMKTILRGVVLKEYLTGKTLLAKIVGLTATLGAGLPLGKEGPFVHIASIVATLLSKAVTSFKGIYENESRNSEMLAAACAVGVACSFAAPIGGVLFSIEVTSVYFAVRNYWRGFFAAVCGAMMFRLMAVWFHDEETLTALFRTSFTKDFPFDPMEIIVFSLIGAACGFLGALFVYVHRRYVMFMRKNKKMKAFLQKSRLLYPFIVVLIYSSLSFPLLFGQFVAGDLTTHQQVDQLFSNITWTKQNPTVYEYSIIRHWETASTNLFVNLILYIVFTFCSSVVASTLPVPSGIFIPVFKMGAALGRIVGELMAIVFPAGLSYGGVNHLIIPGGYAIVGAAAFAGAVTHTISTSVIVFELSGQITHIIPVMIAVLIANGIAQIFQPSIYDSIIRIKKLPYLPDILTSTSGCYNIFVEDFMIRRVKYIWYGITYRQLKAVLIENKKIRALPLVDSPDSMILLGSIQRTDLIMMMDLHLGKERRAGIVSKWKLAADKALEAEFQTVIDNKDSVRSFSSICRSLIPNSDKGDTPSASRVLKNLFNHTKDNDDVAAGNGLEASRSISFDHIDSSANSSPKYPPPRPLPLDDRPTTLSLTHPLPDIDENRKENHTEDGASPLIIEPVLDQRRPSRFAVTKVETPSKSESSVTLQLEPIQMPSDLSVSPEVRLRSRSLPRRGILKKTHSFTLHPSNSPLPSPGPTPHATYATFHGGETSRFRQAVQAVIGKRSSSKPDLNGSKQSFTSFKRNFISPEARLEKTMEQQRLWEQDELDKTVDFGPCHVDPAPFQLVERTSLLKVHSLFSMLSLNHAYVTVIGRLIGVVALKELRRAIEEANQGDFLKYAQESAKPTKDAEEKVPLTK